MFAIIMFLIISLQQSALIKTFIKSPKLQSTLDIDHHEKVLNLKESTWLSSALLLSLEIR